MQAAREVLPLKKFALNETLQQRIRAACRRIRDGEANLQTPSRCPTASSRVQEEALRLAAA